MEEAYSTIPPSTPYFGHPVKYEFDPKKAHALLEEAKCLPCDVTFVISTSGSGQMQPLPMNELIKAELEEVGFRVKLDVMDWNALGQVGRDGIDKHPDDAAINASKAVGDPFYGLIRHVSRAQWAPAGSNWGHYQDAETEELVAKISAEFDAGEAQRAADQAERAHERPGRDDLGGARREPARAVAEAAWFRPGAELVPGPDADHRRRRRRSLMLGYVFRRILFAIPIALGVSVVCFSLVYLAPGDPLQTVLPPDATAETIAIVKHAYGFDRPIPVQYAIWLWHVLHGDFGRSIATQRPVTLEVFGSVANTAMLALFAVPISLLVGYHHGGDRRVLPGRIMDRHRHRRGGDRRQPAELLARAGAGDPVRRRIHGAAGQRHGAVGLGRFRALALERTRNSWSCR